MYIKYILIRILMCLVFRIHHPKRNGLQGLQFLSLAYRVEKMKDAQERSRNAIPLNVILKPHPTKKIAYYIIIFLLFLIGICKKQLNLGSKMSDK